MKKPTIVLWLILFVLSGLPYASLPVRADLDAQAPPFDVDRVVSQARNRIHAERKGFAVENAHHRVEFSAWGLRYLPKAGGESMVSHALGYRLEMIEVGGQIHQVVATTPAIVQPNRVEYARGNGVVEAYVALDEGVEQLFVLNEPLAAGDLALVGRIETDLLAAPGPSGGLRFLADGQEVIRYGQAVAFDAAGARTGIEIRLRGDELALVAPGEWLATAVYPVVVDPVIGGDILISTAEQGQTFPALAYDGTSGWLVVWHDNRDGNYDIYGQRVNNSGSLVGEVITIADTSNDLLYPAIAYDSTQDRYLVVWQDMGATKAISGRVINADGTFFSAAVYLTTGSKLRTRSAVAYNPITDEYLVVWEYEEASGNSDIWARKVGVDGVVDPGGTYQISTMAADELTPALIAYPSSSANAGSYLLVWSNDNSGTYNIVGRQLLNTGAPTGATFGISVGTDETTGDEYRPDVALDTANDRTLVVWEYEPAVSARQVVGRIVDINQVNPRGTWLAIADGGVFEPDVSYNATDGQFLVVWDDGSDLQGRRLDANAAVVGSAFAVSQSPGGQWYGAIAYGIGGYLAVWADYRNSIPDIMGQLLTPTGGLAGFEIGVSTAYLNQQFPALAYSSQQQRWLVVWEDDRDGIRSIYGQFVTRDGLLLGPPIAIGTHGMGQYTPAVAYNSEDDEFLVVWSDWRTGSYDVYGQRVNAATAALSSEFQITTDPDWQWKPAIAYNATDNQYLVAWEDRRNDPGDGSNQDIYSARLKNDGTHWDSFVLDICKEMGMQEKVDVAYNPAQQQYLVVWGDESVEGGRIVGQRVGAGSPWRRGNNLVIPSTSGTWQKNPSVACNMTNGEYLVVWDSSVNIHGRRVSGGGTLPDSSDFVITTAVGSQKEPHVSYDPSTNRYFVCWTDYRDTTTAPDIYGQALSGTGSLLFTDADTNSPIWIYAREQEYPAAASDPADGRGLVVWHDKRNGVSNNVYGRLGEPVDMYQVFLPLVTRND